jgi:hypothetical protein
MSHWTTLIERNQDEMTEGADRAYKFVGMMVMIHESLQNYAEGANIGSQHECSQATEQIGR